MSNTNESNTNQMDADNITTDLVKQQSPADAAAIGNQQDVIASTETPDDASSVVQPTTALEASESTEGTATEEAELQLDSEHLIEALIFSSPEPVAWPRLQAVFPRGQKPSKQEIHALLENIAATWQARGVQLVEVASGWRFQIISSFAPWVQKFHDKKPPKFSRALLETLALIIYKQPITRSEVEDVRGVAVSTHMVKNLLDRGWIKVVGQREVPGRPALYATTKKFLDDFNLCKLSDLPSLDAVVNLEAVEQQMKDQLQHELALPVVSLELDAESEEEDPGEEDLEEEYGEDTTNRRLDSAVGLEHASSEDSTGTDLSDESAAQEKVSVE